MTYGSLAPISHTADYSPACHTELIGCSQWELPPGEAAYPYHFHYADEELVIVLSGQPTLRTPDGTRELEEGEVLHFPVGEEGAHQIYTPPMRPSPTRLQISASPLALEWIWRLPL